MLRSLFLDFVFPVLVFLILRSILRGFFARPRTPVRRNAYGPQPPASPDGPVMELKKDPVCGAYVSPSTGVSRSIQGHVIYFCSAECRDKYVA